MKNTSGLYSLQELVNDVRIYELENPNGFSKPYLYKDMRLEKPFNCITNKKGQVFYDGNNGDKWKIVATNGTTRFYAWNSYQDFLGLFFY